jgi:predicted transcriptional regulator
MEHTHRIADLESRARALNLTPRWLCDSVGVRAQYLSRWKLGHCQPALRVFTPMMRVLEAELDRREREMFWRMARRLLDADQLTALEAAMTPAREAAE